MKTLHEKEVTEQFEKHWEKEFSQLHIEKLRCPSCVERIILYETEHGKNWKFTGKCVALKIIGTYNIYPNILTVNVKRISRITFKNKRMMKDRYFINSIVDIIKWIL